MGENCQFRKYAPAASQNEPLDSLAGKYTDEGHEIFTYNEQ